VEGDRHVDWKTLLAYVTGSVDEQLLLRTEYLVAENSILRDQIKRRLHLSDTERTTLAEIGKRSCRKLSCGTPLEDALVGSKNSCGVALVVFQKPTEPFATLYWTFTLCVLAGHRKEQHVALPLMIPLVMKMLHVLRQRMAERRFPKQDEPRETLLLDRSDPALRVGVQVRRPRRQWHPFHPGCVDELLKKAGQYFPSPLWMR
jgi:hypothetical protein